MKRRLGRKGEKVSRNLCYDARWRGLGPRVRLIGNNTDQESTGSAAACWAG